MYIDYKLKGNVLTASLHGEIDHHSAVIARTEIDTEIDRVKAVGLNLDLSDISFCDSSGLGLVMGRLKKMRASGGSAVVLNPSERVEKVLRLAGIDTLMPIKKEELK
ncbi:MAG: anti-sigma factor antagonist [Clostridia bacterium]|nr:anti-sigma factor antagonist [Clostridia bacterium]MBQ2325012.1 anti-sigma factor antagonist [Clostridia bacterium]MBR6776620.1 anti-sigma factor antagonist [Clostridia bacterium]